MSNALYDSANPERKPSWLMLTRIVPAAGAAMIVPDGTQTYVMKPAATIATASVKFPAKPKDQQPFRLCTTQDITLLTITANTGQTISGGNPVAALMAANTSMAWVYSAVDSTWFKIS